VWRHAFQLVPEGIVGGLADPILLDHARERVSFAGQRARRRGGLFDHRRVLLRDVIHFVDSGVDLLQAGRLRVRIGGDLRDEPGDLADLSFDLLQRLAGISHEFDALADLSGRGQYQRVD